MKTLLIAIAAGATLGLGFAAASAAASPQQHDQSTPKGWNYEIRDGKRVPKGDRTVNADGSWREEIRAGKCITVKEKSPSGEYKETRRCD